MSVKHLSKRVPIMLLTLTVSCMPTSVPSGSKEEPWVGLWSTVAEENSGISTHYVIQFWYENNQLNGKLWKVSKVTNAALRGGIEFAGGDGKNLEMLRLHSVAFAVLEHGRQQLTATIAKEKFTGGIGDSCGELNMILWEDRNNFNGPVNLKGSNKELHFMKRQSNPNNPNPYL